MSFARRAVVASLLAVSLGGCASAHDLAITGKLRPAWERLDREPAARSEVVAAIFRDEAPTLEVTAVGDAELADLVGPLNAQELGRAWVLVRAVLRTRGRSFRDPTFEMTIGHGVGAGAREVPTIRVTRATLASVTREGAPGASLGTTYTGELCPGRLGCAILGPIFPGLFNRETTLRGASDDDWKREAPRAFRLSARLADQRTGDTCARWFFVQRPLDEGEPLELRAAIHLDASSETAANNVAGVVEAHLPARPRLVDRFPIQLDASGARDPVRVDVDAAKPHAESFCRAWKPVDALGGKGECLVDLVPAKGPARLREPPARPAELGTRQDSDARRPSWADAPKGRFEELPDASQARGVDAELIVCHVHHPDHAVWLLGDRSTGWRPFPRSEVIHFPLVHLPERGAIPLQLGEQPGADPPIVRDRLSLTHVGRGIVVTKLHPSPGNDPSFDDVACVAWDRASVEAELAKRWAVADRKLDVADEDALGVQASPRPAAWYRDVGFDLTRLDAAHVAVVECAELVGWADPRVEPLLARAKVIDDRWAEIRRALFSKE